MSKRDLKKYLNELNKEQLEEQILELYEKFTPVKVYYNFVFNPKEETLLQECKLKISHEYFPLQNQRQKKKAKNETFGSSKIHQAFYFIGRRSFCYCRCDAL